MKPLLIFSIICFCLITIQADGDSSDGFVDFLKQVYRNTHLRKGGQVRMNDKGGIDLNYKTKVTYEIGKTRFDIVDFDAHFGVDPEVETFNLTLQNSTFRYNGNLVLNNETNVTFSGATGIMNTIDADYDANKSTSTITLNQSLTDSNSLVLRNSTTLTVSKNTQAFTLNNTISQKDKYKFDLQSKGAWDLQSRGTITRNNTSLGAFTRVDGLNLSTIQEVNFNKNSEQKKDKNGGRGDGGRADGGRGDGGRGNGGRGDGGRGDGGRGNGGRGDGGRGDGGRGDGGRGGGGRGDGGRGDGGRGDGGRGDGGRGDGGRGDGGRGDGGRGDGDPRGCDKKNAQGLGTFKGKSDFQYSTSYVFQNFTNVTKMNGTSVDEGLIQLRDSGLALLGSASYKASISDSSNGKPLNSTTLQGLIESKTVFENYSVLNGTGTNITHFGKLFQRSETNVNSNSTSRVKSLMKGAWVASSTTSNVVTSNTTNQVNTTKSLQYLTKTYNNVTDFDRDCDDRKSKPVIQKGEPTLVASFKTTTLSSNIQNITINLFDGSKPIIDIDGLVTE